MAAGFKTATVNASSVPSTQTDFPAYVDLSRLGITTQAEANSVRVYADSGKTTQWAREIVSASVMWVKVPSLTSTVAIYVDWDGTSVDYAVTDTYGRNAVWSAFGGVYHLNATTDSVGGTSLSEFGSITTGGVSGKIGNATDFDGTNDALGLGDVFNYTTAFTISTWVYFDSVPTTQKQLVSKWYSTGSNRQYMLQTGESGANPSKIRMYYSATGAFEGSNLVVSTTDITATTWILVHGVYDGTNTDAYLYWNGALEATHTTAPSSIPARSSLWAVGALQNGGTLATTALNLDGRLNETRIYNGVRSANWIATEYNNQSAESTFWGTWSTVGGGGNTTNFFYMT